MRPEQWTRVHPLVEEALARPQDTRREFLVAACADDVELREEALSLLTACERSSDTRTLPESWLGLVAAIGPARFEDGEEVAGRYRIERLLGRGGMGEVYEAWDEELSIPVALKTLHFPGPTEDAHQRLRLEGLLARSIWHPHVCRLYDLGRHDDDAGSTWFLTMELLKGRTLAELLADAGRLPRDRALPLALQMAAGLGAAHQAGIVHRDFKPSNVMIVTRDETECAMVTDFGIAMAPVPAGGAENGGAPILGTPTYMAPEQLRGEAVGPQADIFALGVVLFELLTGELPFSGGPELDAAKRRLDDDPPRMDRPELDELWARTILRCLKRDPDRRFQRIEDVATALRGAWEDVPSEVFVRTSGTPTNLPVERDPFVGRELESEELQRGLRNSRLVTLAGAGGMGKTRLAIHHCRLQLSAWPGGVWFCDLSETNDLIGIASAVAGALGVQLGRVDPVDQLGHAIRGRGRCVIVLDNFEQVVEHAESTVGRWLARAPEVRILVTSREKLGLEDGECVLTVGPLSIEAGLALFLSRAQRLRPRLELTEADEGAAREIVRLVDGIPLAIELAAARIRVMSAEQIVAQMRRRFSLLTGGASARHETLIATIDGSWELLNPFEKSAWAQCSVFDDGFTLEAVEAVLDLGSSPAAPNVFDVIQSLVDKSLLRTSVADAWSVHGLPAARFGMYMSLQEYARVKLSEGQSNAGLELSAFQRHGAWYSRYGSEDGIDALDRGGRSAWRRFEVELGNFTGACRRALARGDGETFAACYRAIWAVLLRRGPFTQGVSLGLEALEAGTLDVREKGSVLATLGIAERYSGLTAHSCAHLESAIPLLRESGDRARECAALEGLAEGLAHQGRIQEARRHAEDALTISREIGARRLEGVVHGNLGNLNRWDGRMEEARANWEAALSISREVGNRRSEGAVLNNLGILHCGHGRLDDGKACFEAALLIHTEVGNRNSEGVVLGNLGNLDQDHGRLHEARPRYEAALAIHREVGHRRFEGITLTDLGTLHSALGESEVASAHFEAALAIHREVENRVWEGMTLGDLGLLHYEQGRLEDARACYLSALEIHRETGNRRLQGVALGRLGALLQREGRLDEAWSSIADAEALLRDADDPLEIGKLLCARAELELRTRDVARARETVTEAQGYADRAGAGPASQLGRMLANVRRLVDGTH